MLLAQTYIFGAHVYEPIYILSTYLDGDTHRTRIKKMNFRTIYQPDIYHDFPKTNKEIQAAVKYHNTIYKLIKKTGCEVYFKERI